jgi:hypothetical protein
MPEKKTLARARADRRAGKAPSAQAGEFVREQIDHIRQGRHGARSAQQVIAIGLSEARRAGVNLPPPTGGKTSTQTQKRAARDYARGHDAPAKQAVSAKRSRASEKALQREGTAAVSPQALSRQARSAAARRSPAHKSAAAQRAARIRARHTR